MIFCILLFCYNENLFQTLHYWEEIQSLLDKTAQKILCKFDSLYQDPSYYMTDYMSMDEDTAIHATLTPFTHLNSTMYSFFFYTFQSWNSNLSYQKYTELGQKGNFFTIKSFSAKIYLYSFKCHKLFPDENNMPQRKVEPSYQPVACRQLLTSDLKQAKKVYDRRHFPWDEAKLLNGKPFE